MRRSLAAAAVSLVALQLFGQPAGAANSVDITGASSSGGVTTVTGTVAFPAITAPESVTLGQNVVYDNVATIPDPVMDAAGANLKDAKILPIAGGLRFVWNLNSLPAQIVPEAVRYTWSLKIGTTQFQLQAKRTNMASTTTSEDPVGHAQQLAAQKNFFQLRGACQTSYQGTPVAGCYHLAWLNGSFDIANKTVTMDWPYETRDQIGRLVAPEFKPGVVLEENQTAGTSITANVQAVVSTADTSYFFNGWDPYYAGGRVQLAVGAADNDPATMTYGPAVSLSGGTFTGTVGGLGGTTNTIYARACNGTTCAYDTFTV